MARTRKSHYHYARRFYFTLLAVLVSVALAFTLLDHHAAAPLAAPAPAKTATAGPAPAASDDPLDRVIDFTALQDVNGQVRTWLYAPGSAVDGPVVHEMREGVYEYASKTWDGQDDEAGSYLMPQSAMDDLAQPLPDMVTRILAHTMTGQADPTNDRGFTSLQPVWQTGDAWDRGDRYVYTYRDDKTATRWRIWAALSTTGDDPVYQYPYSPDTRAYTGLLDHAKGGALWTRGDAPDTGTPMLALATCDSAGPERRFILLAVPDAHKGADGAVEDGYAYWLDQWPEQWPEELQAIKGSTGV